MPNLIRAELIPRSGGDPIRLTREVTLVGRHPQCDLVINNAGLSNRHALLVLTDGLLWVRDLASRNGTKVNGQRIKWGAIIPGDELTLGPVKYKVSLGPEPPPSVVDVGPPKSLAPQFEESSESNLFMLQFDEE